MARSRGERQGERKPRSFWLDPRFGIGVGLVVASVLGVVGIVSSTDRTVPVYAAAAALSPGDRVQAADLVVRNVRLGASGDKYLTRADLPRDGVVITRPVSVGELVPAAAVGKASGLRIASVVVTVRGQLPQSVKPGTLVDLWSAREVERGVFGPPTVLVDSATVVRLIKPSGLVAGDTHGVEVLVARGKTAAVLESVANQDSISLVPVALPAGG